MLCVGSAPAHPVVGDDVLVATAAGYANALRSASSLPPVAHG